MTGIPAVDGDPGTRAAVVLFNLGGPDRPAAVEPFLRNLFSDPAILRVPGFIRPWLARRIARRRAKVAEEIYARLGGGSPLLANTEVQARALEACFPEGGVRCFVAMRYWHPLAPATAAAVAAWHPQRIVLLPLYPQYSTTTTGSSLDDWTAAARSAGVSAPTTAVCCYPAEEGFVAALAELTLAGLAEAAGAGTPRVLFSAHGLPERVVAAGDPYQWQVERTAAAVAARAGLAEGSWVVCYQSRVGPLKWIGPSTEAEVDRAGADGVPVVVVPLAFVSEHSETLVELDIEYRERAAEAGVPAYVRVATVGVEDAFVAGLARTVRAALAAPGACWPPDGRRLCPAGLAACPNPAGTVPAG